MYFSFYDLGKENYFSEVLCSDFRTQPVVPLIASIHADFIEPIFYEDDIVMAINQKTGRVVCQAETVMVCYHLAEKHSTEIPAHYRAAIEAYEAKGSVEQSEGLPIQK